VLDQGAVVYHATARELLADNEIKERYCSVRFRPRTRWPCSLRPGGRPRMKMSFWHARPRIHARTGNVR
jgi:hypothetical protein